ncbi:glycine betaine ABC transporter substrate-binding protein [Clostridium sp.]|uniref:glycine betaine ABC transporter substrate-binding protein n=1 Tax=Clostridium sp. TaxID=1506 RepID=UPI0025BF3885|nr:glycine betaine ABC transporter substrate-binding protein [Clostridium sp.]
MKKFKKYITKGLSVVLTIITISMIGCSKKGETVKIATKPMTEQLILGEMLGLLIKENTDLDVEITHGVGGGTSNIQPAILKGEFDLYPEYTGTGWNFVLKEEGIVNEEELFNQYESEYALEWVGMYGFNNTYGLVVRKEIADKYGIKTYSDLAEHASELNFGAEYDFYEREDGYDALSKTYGLNFKSTSDLDIGLKYQAINSKEIDVMNIFTTDGQLSVSDVVVLEDDKKFYPTYYCGTVVRNDTLEKNPELKDVLLKMDNIINDSEMAKLNYEVESNGSNERDVAKEFLISKGLLDN